jgi:hypothetical protein
VKQIGHLDVLDRPKVAKAHFFDEDTRPLDGLNPPFRRAAAVERASTFNFL